MKHLRNTLIAALAIALVAFAIGCAYDGQETGNYPASPAPGHHH